MTTLSNRWLSLLASVCIASSCSSNHRESTSRRDPAVPRQVQPNITDLQRNRERWATRDIKDYRFVLHAGCCGPIRVTSPVSIEVRNGSAVSIAPVKKVRSPLLGGYERFDTIEKLFGVIEEAISRRAELVAVSYDPTSGNPVSVVIDESKTAVDDGFTFRVERLEVIE